MHLKQGKAMSQDNLKEKLKEIDDRIIQLKKEIELGDAIHKLHEDENFIKVVIDGYFDSEEKRIAGLLFNPTKLKRDQLENIMDKATGIRNFKQFIQTVLINAQLAPEQIEEEETFRKQVTSEPVITVEDK